MSLWQWVTDIQLKGEQLLMKGSPRDTFWERKMYQAKNRNKIYL